MSPLPAEGERPAKDRALAVLSTMVGALALSRAVAAPDLPDRILAAAPDSLTREGQCDDPGLPARPAFADRTVAPGG
ncbi:MULTISPECIES: hypothetical protein [Roseomonadaceae]|uniref:Uncharacterized protein n=1 Tax=Falsiroseomonas oleicola TaxID=2801474 RepID=A0ABS6HAH4_9PROT|nr:hypothetical protein [Roseomonas oleicola]MBU8544827.1 hypothetical protein [Roseomonas oleicola]